MLEEERQKNAAAATQAPEDARIRDKLARKFGSLKVEVESGIDCFGHLVASLRLSLYGASDLKTRVKILQP